MMKWLLMSLLIPAFGQLEFNFGQEPNGSDQYTIDCFDNFLKLNAHWVQQTGLTFSYDGPRR
ncbi:MAG: hypothetical protein MJK18_02375, partial [Bdellovibrionales bacterium]|nr:hypothetical protein [Bdellovibrionales bacterium]